MTPPPRSNRSLLTRQCTGTRSPDGLPGILLSTLVIVAYHTMLEGLLGRTVGKLVAGLVVVSEDESPIELGTALKRDLLRVVDGLFFDLVAAVAVWASPTNQRFGTGRRHDRRALADPARQRAASGTAQPDAWE